MLVAESFKCGGVNTLLMLTFHLKKKFGLPCAGDVESEIAVLVATLNTGAHLLITDIAAQLPPTFGDFVNVGDRFHESHVRDRNFRNPDRTQQMAPA